MTSEQGNQVTQQDNELAARISAIFDQGHPIPVHLADIARWVAAHRASVEKEVRLAERNLRLRIHALEKHNQFFARCESGYCNPNKEADPASELHGDRFASEMFRRVDEIADILRAEYPSYGAGETLSFPATRDVVTAVIKVQATLTAESATPRVAPDDASTLNELANWCEKAADWRCCAQCDAAWRHRANTLHRVVAQERGKEGT
jgi:hypothetical protein